MTDKGDTDRWHVSSNDPLTVCDGSGLVVLSARAPEDAVTAAAAPEMRAALASVVAALRGRVHSRDALRALALAEEALTGATAAPAAEAPGTSDDNGLLSRHYALAGFRQGKPIDPGFSPRIISLSPGDGVEVSSAYRRPPMLRELGGTWLHPVRQPMPLTAVIARVLDYDHKDDLERCLGSRAAIASFLGKLVEIMSVRCMLADDDLLTLLPGHEIVDEGTNR